jgi:acetyl esterase/lipase
MKISPVPLIVLAAFLGGLAGLCAATPPSSQKLADLVYKTVGEQPLKLDLYLPEKASTPAPLIVWIHGGGWSGGDKHDVPILSMLANGFAVASVEYRLSGQAPFPAQIEDVKASIRWLRTHSKEYGLDPNRFGVIGHSAGGHLAALAGVTGKEFDAGDNLAASSAVQAVCVMSGPTNIVTMFDGADANRLRALTGLLGGSLPEKRDLAKAASPLTYVRAGAPPYLFVHGIDDPVVPVEQAKTMSRKLEDAGVKSKLILLPETSHDIFPRHDQFVDQIRTFFSETLRPPPT